MDIVCIGGGISGLATAYAIELEAARRGHSKTVSVQVLEAEERLGGKIDTRHLDGFMVEAGANGWLSSKPSTEELCRQLGLYEHTITSCDAARRRFIFRGKRLHRLPEHPISFLFSPLLSLRGKWGVLTEPWAKPAPPFDQDETLADFTRRRLGQEALELLVDPMVSGIFAGDPQRLSLRSAFGRIAAVEAEYGSLIRGLRQIRKTNKEAQATGPAGKLRSCAGGAEMLVHCLAGQLQQRPQLRARVTAVHHHGARYRIDCADGTHLLADCVVLATPAWAAAQLIAPSLDNHLAAELKEIPYASVAVVALGFERRAVRHPLHGFGFLVPQRERRSILGTLWDSSIFTGRAPEGHLLTRTMVGGMRAGHLARQPAPQLIAAVREELRSIMGIKTGPSFTHVVHHQHAIAQYVPGHGARLDRITARLGQHPRLFLTGNAYRGIGVNDCTREAAALAQKLFSPTTGRGP